MKRLRLVGLVNGDESEFDGAWVVEYDPTVVTNGVYDGGVLRVTRDKRKAKTFLSAQDALAYWRQEGLGVNGSGMRKDGMVDRPLTQFNVEIA